MRIHRNRQTALALACLTGLFGACASKTEVRSIDLTRQTGAYVVAYTPRTSVRLAVEQQLIADLAERGMTAFPSSADFPDITTSTSEQILQQANAHRALTVLVINRVASGGVASPVRNPARISPEHPSLRAFYEYSRRQAGAHYDPEREAVVEVNLFLIQDSNAELFWSGTVWSFAADDSGDAIRALSAQIADQLDQVRRTVRGR